MALRISPELPEQRRSRAALSGTEILPELCKDRLDKKGLTQQRGISES